MVNEQTDREVKAAATPPITPNTDTAKPLSDGASNPDPAFGWTAYAELINGRFAMIGFLALIILELITHQSFFQWLFG